LLPALLAFTYESAAGTKVRLTGAPEPVAVGAGVCVAVGEGVSVGAASSVAVAVSVGVGEPAGSVAVGVPVAVGVSVGVGKEPAVAVAVKVAVAVDVFVAVRPGVAEEVGVGPLRTSMTSWGGALPSREENVTPSLLSATSANVYIPLPLIRDVTSYSTHVLDAKEPLLSDAPLSSPGRVFQVTPPEPDSIQPLCAR